MPIKYVRESNKQSDYFETMKSHTYKLISLKISNNIGSFLNNSG